MVPFWGGLLGVCVDREHGPDNHAFRLRVRVLALAASIALGQIVASWLAGTLAPCCNVAVCFRLPGTHLQNRATSGTSVGVSLYGAVPVSSRDVGSSVPLVRRWSPFVPFGPGARRFRRGLTSPPATLVLRCAAQRSSASRFPGSQLART